MAGLSSLKIWGQLWNVSLNPKTGRMLYKIHIRSILTYASLSWVSANLRHLAKAELLSAICSPHPSLHNADRAKRPIQQKILEGVPRLVELILQQDPHQREPAVERRRSRRRYPERPNTG
ncbi:hypothetical protein Trydic_g19034 [Trypoxylus dichotomus]